MTAISTAEIYFLPGIFPKGHELDEALSQRWQKDKIEYERISNLVRYSSTLTQAKMLPSSLASSSTMPIPEVWLSNPELTTSLDASTLAEIDFRVRFCRYYLDVLALPWKNTGIIVYRRSDDIYWLYEHEKEETSSYTGYCSHNSLEWVCSVSLPDYPEWWAAKALQHFRRVESVMVQQESLCFQEALSLAREWTLFGEAYAQARFTRNASEHTLRGIGTKVSAKKGGDARRGSFADLTSCVLSEMQTRIEAGKSVSDAARLVHARGIGTSAEANRKLWGRHKPK